MTGGIEQNELDRLEQDSATVPALIGILGDERQQELWPKAVLVLGWVAPEKGEVVYPLMNFVESAGPMAPLTGNPQSHRYISNPAPAIYPVAFEAKRNALLALGYILQNSLNSRLREASAEGEMYGSGASVHQTALRFLSNGANQQFWTGNIEWKSRPHFETDQQRNADLSAAATEGLEIACNRDSNAVLEGVDSSLRKQLVTVLRVCRAAVPSAHLQR